MNKLNGPSLKQRAFLEERILGEDATILTVKRFEEEPGKPARGFSINIRGPFILAEYEFPDQIETVIDVDAAWAKQPDQPESVSHLHCSWDKARFAAFWKTNDTVQKNIHYKYQMAFFSSKERAKTFNVNEALFWFYIKDENHKGYQKSQIGAVYDLTS